MSTADLARWEPRWRAADAGPGEPERFLVRSIGDLPAGPVLDVAAGAGRNALWLAAGGRPVTAVDIAPAALRRLERAAVARGLAVRTRVADLDACDALAGLGPFASLVVIRFRPAPAQWPRLAAALAPRGRLLLCSFGPDQHRARGFPLAYCLERAALERELALALRLLRWETFAEGGDALAGSIWERTP